MMDNEDWDDLMEIINADLASMAEKKEPVVAAPSLANVNQGSPVLILGQICYKLVPSGAVIPPPLVPNGLLVPPPVVPNGVLVPPSLVPSGALVPPPPPPSPTTPPLLPPKPKKMKTVEGPYIKKPPNAFMIFMQENRPLVKAQFFNIDSANVNKILGQMWKSLTPAQQDPYFQESERLSRLHADMHPEWTCRDNYGRKQKRKWGRAARTSNNVTIPAPVLAPPPFKPSNEGPGPAPTSILGLADSAWSPSCSDAGLEAELLSDLFQQLEDLQPVNAAELLPPPPLPQSSFCYTADVEDLERSTLDIMQYYR
ncbi:transcription factor 7-like 1 [Syngnathoides biaculeatus]|uniref:transcription factor 7-like 1 n=1 Tax=Syngnathoides biaculeatus TaxID=300417 RepID=UPI002ADDE601|nr:transcription factor 7-like 1 [Syngnathoides biaculeatus]